MHPETYGHVPALVAPASEPRGTVLPLHGQHADALANVKELASLQGAGFHAVGLDAPEHGRRHVEEQSALDVHIAAAAAEINAVVDDLGAAGLAGPYGIVGISLGAFSAPRWRSSPARPIGCPKTSGGMRGAA